MRVADHRYRALTGPLSFHYSIPFHSIPPFQSSPFHHSIPSFQSTESKHPINSSCSNSSLQWQYSRSVARMSNLSPDRPHLSLCSRLGGLLSRPLAVRSRMLSAGYFLLKERSLFELICSKADFCI